MTDIKQDKRDYNREYMRMYRITHKDELHKYRTQKDRKEKENAKNREYYQNNKEVIRVQAREYYEKHRQDRLEYARNYRKNNATVVAERNKKYRRLHPNKNTYFLKFPEKRAVYERNRRARKNGRGGRITKGEWEQLCDKYGNRCLHCGRSDVKLTLDHVVPLKLGGSHTIDNVQPLCMKCNSSKYTKIIDYRTREDFR